MMYCGAVYAAKTWFWPKKDLDHDGKGLNINFSKILQLNEMDGGFRGSREVIVMSKVVDGTRLLIIVIRIGQ